MISFDLKCGHGHVFEGWFRSSTAYEEQRSGGLIACPLCGNCDIAKAVMAPAVAAKGNRAGSGTPAGSAFQLANPDEASAKAMLAAIAQAQAKALEQSSWVGDRFGDLVRAMHYGEADHAPIHGTANAEQARAMIEEGLPVAPLIVPIAPPDQTH